MKDAPGYPLPSGELGDDDIVCQLIYLPDRPEYWQALVGALSYMATWRAWERDGDKRGKDAASDWRVAFELTMECWRMACLEQLQDDVAAILAIMQIPDPCCDPGDFTDGDRYTDRVIDGEDDVPQPIIDAGYAEDAADWDGFDDYKCMISHVIVDQLVAKLNEIEPLVDASGAILGGVTALAGILAVIVGTGGLAIVFGIVAGIGATSLLYQALTDFDWVGTLSDKVVTNHNDLVCSVYRSDGDTDALSSLNDKIDELFTTPEALILKNMNLGPTLKALYAGRYDQQDIADILLDAGYELGDFSCDCDQVGEYLSYTDFETETWEDWENETGWIINEGMDSGWCWRSSFNESTHLLYHSVGTLLEQMELPFRAGTIITIHRVKFYYRMSGGAAKYQMTCAHDGGQFQDSYDNEASWTEVEEFFDPPHECTYPIQNVVQFRRDGTLYYGYIDRITIDFDYQY